MELKERIDLAKKATQQAKEHLLKTFAAVPDDKLNWSPAPEARTPLWLVGHCGTSNTAFLAFLRGEKPQLPEDREEMSKAIRNGGRDMKTREEAVKSVEDTTAAILDAMDKVTDEMLASSPSTPVGEMPFTVWLEIPGSHMAVHASQVDYLQTCWGDLQEH